MITEKKSFDNLLIANENVKEATLNSLAVTLYEFFNELKNPNIFNAIEEHATKEKNKDTAFLRKYEEELLQKLQSQLEKIENYCNERSIILPINFFDIKIDDYRQDKIISDLHTIDVLIQIISRMLSSLMHTHISKEEILKLIQRHAIFHLNHEDEESWRLIDPSDKGIQTAYTKIKKFVCTKKIFNEQLTNLLDEFNIPSKNNKSNTNVYILLHILQLLFQSDLTSTHHYNFVKQYANLDKNGQIIELKINPLINQWRNEQKEIENTKKATFWYGWEQFKQFYEDCKNNGFITNQPEYMNKLKRYQQKIFLFIQELSSITVAASTDNKMLITATCDNNKITFSMHNQSDEIVLKKYDTKNGNLQETNQYKVFNAILSNQFSIKIETLIESLGLKETQIRRAQRSINNTFRKKWKIQKYISTSKKKLKINSNYLTKLHP